MFTMFGIEMVREHSKPSRQPEQKVRGMSKGALEILERQQIAKRSLLGNWILHTQKVLGFLTPYI